MTTPGGPEVLDVVERLDVNAVGGRVRIRVHAATVNPTDLALRAGQRPRAAGSDGPRIPGMEAAGVIDEIGPDVTGLTVGDEVMAIVVPSRPEGGAYVEQLVVDADQVARAPRGVTLVEAATLPMNGLTAVRALDMLDLPQGSTLAVSGAAGALGGYVLQLAAHRGLRVIAIASERDAALLRELGPHELVPRGDDAAERVRELVPEGVDGAVDTALLHERIVPAVRDGGGFAVVRGWPEEAGRGITVHRVMVAEYAHRADLLAELATLVEEGVLTLRVARTFTAEDAPEAHRLMEAGGVRGRLVLTF
ncbi:NADP-dependent oxidoreductase [Georgenia halophila]|uniref:NADP-dependent oxidoreductase n=1 Tax=Georgenia halophila TaxID=620889 RepID=A0ABP8KTE4_9MICO